MTHSVSIRLFGAFRIETSDGVEIPIRSTKLRALIALLALAPDGTHTRAWLQQVLWGRSGPELGRSSLRRALSDLRRCLGETFDEVFFATNIDVRLNQTRVEITGSPSDGEFLEGLDINEPRFIEWLMERREQAYDRRLRMPSLISARLSPSICVVPFAPVIQDNQSKHLGDLMALEVTRVLSRCPLIDTISHLSSRRFQLTTLDVATLRQQLNADYLIFGTIRHNDANISVSCDLVELQSERVCWSRQMDMSLKEISGAEWAAPRDIAQMALETIVTQSVQAVQGLDRTRLKVHQRLMAAISMLHQHQELVVHRARRLLEELIEEFPGHAILHAWLAKFYVLNANQGWSTDIQGDAARASHLAQQALAYDPACSFSRAIHGLVLSNLHSNFRGGAEAMDQALETNSSNALAWLLKGAMLAFSDQGAEAVLCTSKARNLSPLDPHKYYFDCLSGTAHLAIEDYTTALRLAERSYLANPRHASTLRVRTIALQELGQTQAAQQSAQEILDKDPNFTVEGYLQFHPAAEFQSGETWARALSQSGIPLR
ncbi:hypothetical protein V8J82_12965 [Gymnodinialimonas sp. 2305UL16-5]|uniref:hypothetical protein n=1 Tax=Gymnodinialimonas mytili TaxID=3126503 RepID=UPI00309E5438